MSNAVVPVATLPLVPAPKSGFLTTEFWVAISAVACSALVALNVVPSADVPQIEGWLQTLIGDLASKDFMGLLIAMIPVVQYIRSRSSVQAAHQAAQGQAAAVVPSGHPLMDAVRKALLAATASLPAQIPVRSPVAPQATLVIEPAAPEVPAGTPVAKAPALPDSAFSV